MKKIVLLLATVGCFGFAANAQTQGAVRKLIIGPELGIPLEKDSKTIIVGGSIQFEQPIAKSLNLTLSAGYQSVMLTGGPRTIVKQSGLRPSYDALPIKVGAKYYFGKYFYGGADAGVVFTSKEYVGTAFIYSPTVGSSFAVGKKSSLDLGVRYETRVQKYNNTWGFLGIRAAFAFGL